MATGVGGLRAVHTLVQRIGLDTAINKSLKLLKRHLPYHESDHVLTLAYSNLCGGERLDDVEMLRTDGALLNVLGAERLPDPTTAGDFLRRFTSMGTVDALQRTVNGVRQQVWSEARVGEGDVAVIDVDGSICPTTGEKKRGMDMSYTGEWSYHRSSSRWRTRASPCSWSTVLAIAPATTDV